MVVLVALSRYREAVMAMISNGHDIML